VPDDSHSIFALGIGILTLVFHVVTGTGNARVVIHRPKSSKRDDGGGPLIDA
jgi:hypothetical protein